MRNLVQPPPTMRCKFCDGELRFSSVEPDDPTFDIEIQIFVCVKCGHVHPRKVMHDPYAAHAANWVPPSKAGQLSR